MPRLTNDGCEAGITPRMQAMRLRLARNPASVLWDFAGQCLAPDGDQTIRRLFLRLAANFSAGELDAGLELLSTLDLCAQVDKIAIPAGYCTEATIASCRSPARKCCRLCCSLRDF